MAGLWWATRYGKPLPTPGHFRYGRVHIALDNSTLCGQDDVVNAMFAAAGAPDCRTCMRIATKRLAREG